MQWHCLQGRPSTTLRFDAMFSCTLGFLVTYNITARTVQHDPDTLEVLGHLVLDRTQDFAKSRLLGNNIWEESAALLPSAALNADHLLLPIDSDNGYVASLQKLSEAAMIQLLYLQSTVLKTLRCRVGTQSQTSLQHDHNHMVEHSTTPVLLHSALAIISTIALLPTPAKLSKKAGSVSNHSGQPDSSVGTTQQMLLHALRLTADGIHARHVLDGQQPESTAAAVDNTTLDRQQLSHSCLYLQQRLADRLVSLIRIYAARGDDGASASCSVLQVLLHKNNPLASAVAAHCQRSGL